MGDVYQAEDTILDRAVAVKLMHPAMASQPQARQRFLGEARAAARLTHDHVVTLYHLGEEGDTPYLVMQMLEGETLDERLEHGAALPLADALHIGREVALGLGASHARGLIHRDVKPSNVWLEAGTLRAKILDFGLVGAVEDGAEVTGAGEFVGTPGYMAPEQARCEAVDARCDLFSLGCLLYRMVTGRRAFGGQSVSDVLQAVANRTPAPAHEFNPGAPPALSLLLQKMLDKDPNRRPANALEVVDSLRQIERGLDATPPPPGLLGFAPPAGPPGGSVRDGTAPAPPAKGPDVRLESPGKRP